MKILVTPEELADIARLQIEGVISSSSAKIVIRTIWQDRENRLAAAIKTLAPDLSDDQCKALVRRIDWDDVLKRDPEQKEEFGQ